MSLPRVPQQQKVDAWAVVSQAPGENFPAFWTGTWAKEGTLRALFTYSAESAVFFRTERAAVLAQLCFPGLRIPRAYAPR